MASSASAIASLRADFDGRTIVPGDPDYDRARDVFASAVYDRRPAVIVRPNNAAEVAKVVTTARETGLPLAVRCGGHSSVGHGVCDDGIVLDLVNLRGLEVDPAGRTAWAEGGWTAGGLTAALAEHELAVGFGDTGSVGIGGITLGGGHGYLSRASGLTVDNLVGAEIVTADGQILQTDAGNHPDLFWAIRGGGGNFGVATRFQYRLREVSTILGGMLLLPATAETVEGFMTIADGAPDELMALGNVMPAMPLPFIPEEHHGRLSIMALVCWCGPMDEGERVIGQLRALGEPLADMVQPMPYPGMFFEPESDDGEEYRPTAAARTMFMDRVDGDVAELIMRRLESSDAAMRVVQLRPMGGAIARVPVEDTAFAHRQSRIMTNIAAFYEGPDDRPRREEWVTKTAADLRQQDAGAYVNFLGDEGPDAVRSAYPGATWDRLTRIKAEYDPGNLFRLNQNIPPA
jgi:FAD binding domain/Berberine and berberine like